MKAIKEPKGAEREYDNIDRFVIVFHDELVNMMSKDPDIASTWVPDKADPRAFSGDNLRAFDFWSDEDEWSANRGVDNFYYQLLFNPPYSGKWDRQSRAICYVQACYYKESEIKRLIPEVEAFASLCRTHLPEFSIQPSERHYIRYQKLYYELNAGFLERCLGASRKLVVGMNTLHREILSAPASRNRYTPSPGTRSETKGDVMTAWFEDLPLDFTREDTRRAEQLLVTGYPINMAMLTLAQNAGLNLAQMNQQAPVQFLARDVLVKARQSERLLQLLVEVLRDPGQEAIQEELWRLVAGHEASISASAMKRKPSLATLATLPPSMEVWGPEEKEAQPLAANFEKIINAAAGFEEPAVLRRRLAEAEVRTARIDVGGKAKGTGFLVSNRHLLTAWHVVKGGVQGAVARFDHKQSPGGTEVDPGRAVAFATDWRAAHSPHELVKLEVGADGPSEGSWDFALVRLAEPVGFQAIGSDPEANAEKRGHYDLDGSPYAFDEAEPLRIVGHPQGRPVQLSWASPSQVRWTKHLNRLRYHTNTEGGSSGSPVFNRDWRVVALHHAAGPTSIPGEFHLSTGEFNQGIPISSIVAELKKQLAATNELKELGLE